MRSSLTIFIIGFLLGSTLGLGGLYTQVLQPAWQEVEELEQENGVMKEALNTAGDALREAADSLRGDSSPSPLKPSDIFGGASGDRIAPEGDEPRKVTTRFDGADRKELASRLESIAGRLEKARKNREEK